MATTLMPAIKKCVPMMRSAVVPMESIVSDASNSSSSTSGISSKAAKPRIMMPMAVKMLSLTVFFTRSGLRAP